MKSFEQLIAPISVAEFSEVYWRKTPLYLVKDTDTSKILSVEEINAYLGRECLTYPFIRMVGNGKELDKKKYFLNYTAEYNLLDKGRVFELFAEGNTIVLQAAHLNFSNLNKFTKSLESELGMQVHANVYITPSNSQGFHPHYDTHEVFVVQIAGAKGWNLYDVPIQAPIKGWQLNDKERKHYLESKPAHEIKLQEGDVLYVPSGAVHDAYTVDEFSIHITFGVHAVTRLDVMNDLVEKLKRVPFFREPLNPFLKDHDQATPSKEEMISKVIKSLNELIERPSELTAHKKLYRDTTDVFKSLMQLDVLRFADELDSIEVVTGSAIPDDLSPNEADIYQRLLPVEFDSQRFNMEGHRLEDLKSALKSLARKGLIRICQKEMQPFK